MSQSKLPNTLPPGVPGADPRKPLPPRPAQEDLPPRSLPLPRPTVPASVAPDERQIRPTVHSARYELRHVALTLSFFLLVVLPTAVAGWYLWARAQDQYVSTIGFSVRKEDAEPAVDILGGLSKITGGGTGSALDTDILYDFLRSEEIVARVDEAIDLRTRFSRAWPADTVFAYNPAGTIEDLTDYWARQVRVDYDTSVQLITVRVAAFTPEDAKTIASAAFNESSRTINRLSAIARDDAIRFARDELAAAQERLTATRQAMTAFRMRTQIVDPAADITGQMGILTSLQANLAAALIDSDILSQNTAKGDQRIIQADQKIEAIRERIAEERAKFGASRTTDGGENYAEVMAEYEKLTSDLEFDSAVYRSAQANYDVALAEARRQTRYLAAHIEPRLAQTSLVPNRPVLLATLFGGLLLGWSVLLLIYYSIRDRR